MGDFNDCASSEERKGFHPHTRCGVSRNGFRSAFLGKEKMPKELSAENK